MKDSKLKRLELLLQRVNDLPDEIISSDDFPHNEEREQRIMMTEKYNQKQEDIFSELDDIIFTLRAFVKLNFGKDSEYFDGIHKINFTSKDTAGYIMNTFTLSHNKFWQAGLGKLKSLLLNMKAELIEKIEIEKSEKKSVKQQILRGAIFISLLAIILFTIWSPDFFLFEYLNVKSNLNLIRLTLSLFTLPYLLSILMPQHWKILIPLGTALIGVIVTLMKV